MGVVKAMVGFGRPSSNRSDNNRVDAAVIREATMEDGLRHVIMTIEGLIELEERFAALEKDLLGSESLNVDPLPDPAELGLDGLVPRLMEAALLIGATSRRMHLRMGLIEGAMGRRARPVSHVVKGSDKPSYAKVDAKPATQIETPVADQDTVLID